MKFLDNDIKKIYESSPELFPSEELEIRDDIIIQILNKILEGSAKWTNTEKKQLSYNIKNKQNNWESNIEKIKKFIINWIKNKNLKIKKEKDKEQIKTIMRGLLEKNEDKRIRTLKIVSELKNLKNNQYKDYNWVPTRQVVYSIISCLREEYRENDFKNGYLISGVVLDESSSKVDGWQFTRDKILILKYFDKEIEKYNRAIKNFQVYKEKLEDQLI